MRKNSSDNKLPDEIYKNSIFPRFTAIPIAIFLVMLGFFSHFPVYERGKSFIIDSLGANKRCPITLNDLNITAFSPKIKLSGISIPGRCMGKGAPKLLVDEVIVAPKAPTFGPMRANVGIDMSLGNTDLFVKSSIGNRFIKAEFTKGSVIDLEDFSSFLKEFVKGVVFVHGEVSLNGRQIKDAKISISSNNFQVNKNVIKNFEIPQMSIGKVELQAKIGADLTIYVKRLVVGREGAPFQANLKGKIKIDKKRPRNSDIRLYGDFKVSDQFRNKDFPILNLFLSGKKKNSEGYFNMRIDGPMKKPSFRFN